MKKLLLSIAAAMTMLHASAQSIYKSVQSNVSFFAGTPVEDINAVSTQANSFLNLETGEVVVRIPMTSFVFEESLMQEHFNENYIESGKYPNAEFTGKIENVSQLNWKESNAFNITVAGTLKIHGVAKPRTISVELTKQNGKIEAISNFQIALEDHKIDRPRILWEKLADKVDVKLKFIYEVYKASANR
jgi:hypothetical protein